MTSPLLFPVESAVAARQPKTDNLMLARFLRDDARDNRLEEEDLRAAHEILVKWADLETSGHLETLTETQWEGDFVAQVFGDALGYAGPADEAEMFHRIAKEPLATDVPDATLGKFQPGGERQPLAVVELKGPKVHLDRDRSRGRTAVDQCWDYLINTPPACRWGIVTNLVSFRLYERDSTKRAYEHFSLQELRKFDTFRQFYYLFHRQGLIDNWLHEAPRAKHLLEKSKNRQREVGDKLYLNYSEHRMELIRVLHHQHGHPVDDAVEMAQRLFDRVIFIAFCEDRGLLKRHTIQRAHDELPSFSDATNPRWQNFKNLFRFIDQGSTRHDIPGYNGGLFADHAVDELDLPDDPWTGFFKAIGGYDFADEVNLDVLGHLFEQSITELEKLKETGLFADAEKAERYAQMPQSARRKQLGVYYTPPELTSRIVQYTVEELIDRRFADLAVQFGVARQEADKGAAPDDAAYWRRCLETLRRLKIVDPACGSGAFLFQAYNVLEQRYHEVIGHLEAADRSGICERSGSRETSGPNSHEFGYDPQKLLENIPQFILQENLYGVDLSPEAVEITQLALWIRSATRGHTLATLSKNIVHGNSLVHDAAVHPAGFDWAERFPEVFLPLPLGEGRGEGREEAGFDCVIGNPPWERIKLQEREFFSLPAPEIATATNAAKRRVLIAKLPDEDPELFARYEAEQQSAQALLDYCRRSGEYPLTGRGDINTYAVFAELAYRIVGADGRVGVLVPSGIAMHHTTRDFFGALAVGDKLIRLFEFDNRRGNFFPDVHRDTQFVILNFGGSAVRVDQPEFIFGAMDVDELENRKRRVILTGDDIQLLNPNTRTCPIFRSRRDAEITKAIYRRVPVLIDHNREGPTCNPWGISFNRMFDQTNDAEHFREAHVLESRGYGLQTNLWSKDDERYLPLYEAKMFHQYDHRFGTVFEDTSNWINQGQTIETNVVQHANPEFHVLPRYWASYNEVRQRAAMPAAHLAFRDITNPTNRRTMISGFVPAVGFTNTLPIILFDDMVTMLRRTCLQANFSSFVFDYVARQKMQGRHMNFYILEQLSTLPPDTYDKPCPWEAGVSLENWISERVLKLSCTAVDMLPLAEACDFTSGSFQREYGGRLNKWDERERAELLAELDAAFFHLYGIERDDVEYILSTFNGIHDSQPLLPGHVSQAQRIAQKFAQMSFGPTG